MFSVNQVSDRIHERSQVLEAFEALELSDEIANTRRLLLKALFPENQSLMGGCLFFVLRTLIATKSIDLLGRFKSDNPYALWLLELLNAVRHDHRLLELLEPQKFITRVKKVKARLKDAARGPQSNLCELFLTPLGESPISTNNCENQRCEPQLLCLAMFTLIKSLQFENIVSTGSQDHRLVQLADELRKLSDLTIHPDYAEHIKGSPEERWWHFSQWLGGQPSLCEPQSYILYSFNLSASLSKGDSKNDNALVGNLIRAALNTIGAIHPELKKYPEGFNALKSNISLETLIGDPSITYIPITGDLGPNKPSELNLHSYGDEDDEEKSTLVVTDDENETVILRELSERIYNPDFINFYPTNPYWSPERFKFLLSLPERPCDNEEPINEMEALVAWLTAESGLTGEPLVDLILGRDPKLNWRISDDGHYLERPRFARQTNITTISDQLTPLGKSEKRRLPNSLVKPIRQLRNSDDNTRKALHFQVSKLTRKDTACLLLGRQTQGIPQALSLLLYTNNSEQLPAKTSYYSLIDKHPASKMLGIQAQGLTPSNIVGSPFHVEAENRERFIIEKMRQLMASDGNAIAQFNKIALFCTSLILLFTGARPNQDPFDDPRHIGLDDHLILIGDKIIDEHAPFRVAPLPEIVSQLIKNLWLTILEQIKSATTNKKVAESLERILSFSAPKGLPFFFLLCENNKHGWRSITPTDLSTSWGGELPANIFRHNFAAMCQGIVHQDCIDYVLGHSLLGIQCYSINSSRTLQEDFDSLRKAFAHLAQLLGAEVEPINEQTLSELVRHCDTSLDCNESAFGVSRRLDRKKDLSVIAQTQANQIVEQILKYEFDSFGIRDLEEFFNKFPMFTPMPGTYLETLEILATRLQKEIGPRSKIRKIGLPSPLAPSFTPAVLDGQKRLKECIVSLNNSHSLFNRRSSRLSLIGAILRIIFIHGLTQKRLLQKLLNNRWKIFSLGDFTYLNFLADDDDCEMDRIKIDQITFSMLTSGPSKSAVKTITNAEIDAIKTVLPELALVKQQTYDLLDLLSPALKMISEVNWIRLPGFGAAAVNGEILTFCDSDNSLVWRNIPGFELLNRTRSNNTSDDTPAQPLTRKKSQTDLNKATEEIFSAIRKIDQDGREASLSELKKLTANAPNKSDNLLLYQYAIFLITRKSTFGTREFLTQNTILRYCSSVRKFLQFAEQTDPMWLSSSEHEIQDLVSQHLSYLSRETAGAEVKHIREFLKFSFDFSGLKTPAWVIGQEHKPRDIVLPEDLFETLLDSFLNLPGANKSIRVATQSILILAYRYGLRSGEIEGLRHREVKLRGLIPIIHLYRSGKEHLKTTAANRTIAPISILPSNEINILNSQFRSSSGLEEGLVFSQNIWRQAYTLAIAATKTFDSGLDLHGLREYRPTVACSIATLDPMNSKRQFELNACLLGQRYGSVLFGYSIKSQIGHASFQMTLENYTKNICEVSCEKITNSVGLDLRAYSGQILH